MEYLEDIDLSKLSPFTLYCIKKQYDFDTKVLKKSKSDFSFIDIRRISNYCHGFKVGEFLKAKRKYNNLLNKRSRIKKDIELLLEKECIFLTLTFDDEHIDMLDKRQAICRWLRKLNCNYLGNVDYGEISGRIHYHVIVQCDKVDYSTYKYGAINGKRIKNNNVNALKRYIVKLTNHACKESTKNEERILKCFKYELC